MDKKASGSRRPKSVPNGDCANLEDYVVQTAIEPESADAAKKRQNSKKGTSSSSACSFSNETEVFERSGNKKLPRNKSSSFNIGDSGSFRSERKAKCTSETFSGVSVNLNSSGNLRKDKSRRASVPNGSGNGKSGACFSPASKSSSSKTSESSKSRFNCPSTSSRGPASSVKSGSSSFRKVKFEPYIPLFKVQQGLKKNEFIEGALRINPRNYEDAYVSPPDGKMDIYIGGRRNRNRALNGDMVVVEINQKQDWRILYDAVKNHEDKTGESIAGSVYRPSPSPSCKIHPPDRLQKSRPMSSTSWSSSFGTSRPPDTLEILGLDKLTKQFDDLTVDHKKRTSKGKKLKHHTKTSNGNASVSQESSDSAMDKMSPNFGDLSDIQSVSIVTDKDSTHDESKDGDSLNLHPSTSDHVSHPACDMNEIGTFDFTQVKEKGVSDAWQEEVSTMNITISPEELLLSADGQSIVEYDNHFDESGSELDVVIVPPGDLSGDEFTDSASVSSDHSNTHEQMLEDASFLACQQDADNNNMNATDTVVFTDNVVNRFALSTVISTASTQNKSIEFDCRRQENINTSSITNYEINCDTVVCSVVSDALAQNNSSSSDENANAVPESRLPDNANNCSQQDVMPIPGKKAKRKRKRKPRKKQLESKIDDVARNENSSPATRNLTIDDILAHPLWEKFVQRTGKVVYISESKHSSVVAGHLKLCPDKNSKWALFSPNDSGSPRIMIPMSECPQNFYRRPGDYATVIFLAEIVEWNENSSFASGHLVRTLGKSGDVEVETEALLVDSGVDTSDFPPEVLECLPQEESWCVPPLELAKRKDFRKECLFTIDPATARDMDDAVSCDRLDNGNFKVGVHIADVTYFVREGTTLDEIAKRRSTSVYLVQKVVPMLPRLLCDNLCSLTPGTDRLAFSIVWEMTPKGKIVHQWIGRSVINSCVKLSYEHAQSMIENPDKILVADEFPPFFGDFVVDDVAQRVADLHFLSLCLQKKRFDNGALRLDQVKIQFTLDSETGLPSGFNVYERKDSNSLIEEFMLLANMSVAEHIYKAFPETAMLRRHPPPQSKPMEDAVAICNAMGYILDASDSGALHNSIFQYKGDDFLSKATTQLMINMCSKPMNQALYFCTGVVNDTSLFHHYALNVPLYTHFTSPIRRYPDIVVHRLLAASLGYDPPPRSTPHEVNRCATHCNDKKYNAKRVSEQSSELFLAAFVREMRSVRARAMVLGVMDHSIDCLVLEMGVVKRCYCDKLDLVKTDFKKTHGVPQLNIFWRDPEHEGGLEQALAPFAVVDVVLSVEPESLRIKVTLIKPE